ncbi:MAG: hypothetical protein AAF290_09385 [Pseudomonadota bacterium]
MLFWLQATYRQLDTLRESRQLPHAIMLTGRRGLGKRQLALQLAADGLTATVLTDAVGASLTPEDLRSPDFHYVSPLEDKKQISIDQIRVLSEKLGLSAHAGQKVAVIDTADSMTLAAANALLKTLEEPAGDCTLILLADDLSRIPATIISRCVTFRIPTPPRSQSQQWIAEQGNSAADAATALMLHNDAPVAALAALADGSVAVLAQIEQDIAAIVDGRKPPLAIAEAWRSYEIRDVLRALEVVTSRWIYPDSERLGTTSKFRDYVIDTRDAFCYLDKLKSARKATQGSVNTELAIDSLVLPWQNGLAGLASPLRGH